MSGRVEDVTPGDRHCAAILEAAVELFHEVPLREVTVRRIAERAGVNPSLIYRYFGRLDSLFRAVSDDPAVMAASVPASGSTADPGSSMSDRALRSSRVQPRDQSPSNSAARRSKSSSCRAVGAAAGDARVLAALRGWMASTAAAPLANGAGSVCGR